MAEFQGEQCEVLGISDFNEIYIACKSVSARWRDLGIRLGVKKPTLDIIQANNRGDVEGCMFDLIGNWLKGSSEEVVMPSWRNLCSALRRIDKSLAVELSAKHNVDENTHTVESGCISLPSDDSAVFLPQMCGCGKCTIIGWRTNTQCENIQYSKFPKLLLVDSSHPSAATFEQVYDKHASLCKATKKVINQFRIVCDNTWDALFDAVESHKLTVIKITRKLRSWLGIELPMFSDLDSLQNHMHSLRVSWYSYRPLYSLVDHFLKNFYPDLLSDWNIYLSTFREYCMKRNLSEYVNVFFQVGEEHNVFLLEVDEFFDKFTLADIEALSDSLSLALDVPSVCLHLVTVKKGSLIIYFYYCFSDYLVIFQDLKLHQLQMVSEIKVARILSLADLQKQFAYNNIQKYNYQYMEQNEDCPPLTAETQDIPSMLPGKTSSTSSSTTEMSKGDELDEIEEIKMLTDVWKKQVFGKDCELSQKDAELQEAKEKLNSLVKMSLTKDEEISTIELEKIRLERFKEYDISQKEDMLTQLHEDIIRSKEILELWKKISFINDEESRAEMMKSAIIKEMKFRKFLKIDLQFQFCQTTVCPDGRIFATDHSTHTVLILSADWKLIKTFGGRGENEGEFEFPCGIAVTADEYILVTDHHRLQKLTQEGICESFVGSSSSDTSSQPQFNGPSGIAVHPITGDIFVADRFNNRIQVVHADLTFSSTITLRDGKQFDQPFDISFDNQGHIYVTEIGNDCITKLTITGQFITRFGSHGSAPGQLSHPCCLAISNNLVYVSEQGNHRVSIFDLNGRYYDCFGRSSLTEPRGISIDNFGKIYICDFGSKNMMVF